ncbi:MAG: GAF domain-containing sensor histidine kinase [Candidatus Saccharimonadales bacterium]
MLYEFPLLLLTNIIAIAMVMVILLARTVRPILQAALSITIISLVLWQDMIFIADNATQHLRLINTLIFLWPTIAIAGFYVFLGRLDVRGRKANGSKGRLKPTLMAAFLFGITLQVGALLTTRVFDDVALTQEGVYEFTRGYAYYVYIVGLGVALISLVARLLSSVSAVRRHAKERQALITVLYTTCIASVCGIIFNVLIPVLADNQDFISLGFVTIDIFAIGFALSVVRGQLLDIKLYAIRGVVYLLSLMTLAGIYALIAFVVSEWFFGSSTSSEQTMLNAAMALLLAFIFQPIKRFFDRITNHFFFRDNYNTSEFYARLSRLLTSTTDLRGLLQRAADEIATTLKGEYGLFFVYDENHYVMTGTTKSRHRMPVQDARAIDDYVEQYGSGVIVADLLTENDHLRRLLVSHKVCLVLPLQRGSDGIIGYFLMGDHLSSNYTRRDIRALETVADELVIAIQNALSVQEVKELNATLQQRIDEATKELRASNAQLQRLDEAKDEFVSMASHQLRTPLTSVKGYIDMVLEGDAGEISDMQKHLLGEAFTSSERMVHLINDFLNVSRLQTGKFMIDRRQIDLASVIRQEVDGLRTTAGQRKLTLTYDTPASFPLLYLDEGKMRQVVMNFIDNAIYYSKEDTTITVSLSTEADVLTFTVKDTGIGVPVDEQAQLFSKFYRASNARKQRPDGTGVGLYLAKKVIVAHGGEVIFSSAPGKGSTFGFTLPIKRMSVAPVSDTDDFDNQPNK